MRFRIEQMFAATAGEVCAALCDPSYLAAMGDLPDISAPTVRAQERDLAASVVRQELEFRFRGKLPSAVTRVIDPARLSWVEHDEIDLVARRCRFRMVPVHYQKFFTCSGTWTVTDAANGARRTIEGDLKVNSPIPLVGGKVEKAIVSGLQERLAHEPTVFATWKGRG